MTVRCDRGLRQGGEDDVEGVGAFEACGVDGGADVGFSFGGPHGAIAVGDLSLDHAGGGVCAPRADPSHCMLRLTGSADFRTP